MNFYSGKVEELVKIDHLEKNIIIKWGIENSLKYLGSLLQKIDDGSINDDVSIDDYIYIQGKRTEIENHLKNLRESKVKVEKEFQELKHIFN